MNFRMMKLYLFVAAFGPKAKQTESNGFLLVPQLAKHSYTLLENVRCSIKMVDV